MSLKSPDWYNYIDNDIQQKTLTSVGFSNLIATKPYAIDDETFAGYHARYAQIKEFQSITRDIFWASLEGDADPEIAESVLSCQPPCRGKEYHLSLPKELRSTPLFFRTDEGTPGTIVEIQCPGSAWEIVDQLRACYSAFPEQFGKPTRFKQNLAEQLSQSLHKHLGETPIVHHLLNNSSRPHGSVYFIQSCREQGIKFYGWDDVRSHDCNFIRGHEFFDLRYNGFFEQWLTASKEQKLAFDHPPTPLYDAKVIMAWAFWSKTRDYYPDSVRQLFPYTAIISPDGFHLEDGTWVTLDQFFNELGIKQRNYYFKFAGIDPTRNWGSRAVFYTGSFSRPQRQIMQEQIVSNYNQGDRWIAQKRCEYPEVATAINRDGLETGGKVYTKPSGFYGPDGCYGILAMQQNEHKVHGTPQTIVSCVF